MTKAEKILLDYVVNTPQGTMVDESPNFEELRATVVAELMSPDTKRTWIAAWLKRQVAIEDWRSTTDALKLPSDFDVRPWRDEAEREWENS